MFTPGNDVVCIKDHSKKVVTRHSIYPLNEIVELKCCGLVVLDVGIKLHPDNLFYKCTCGHVLPLFITTSRVHYLSSELFAPIDDILNEEIEELLTQETIHTT